MNVLFLTQTDQIGASARYRVYQYLSYLRKEGINYVVSPAVRARVLNRYNSNNFNIINKAAYYFSIISKRIDDLKRVNVFDCVFLQRDILVHVYPFVEKLIAARQKNIIFDFDDAIALYPRSRRLGILFRPFWDKRKIERIIKLSKHIIVGNNFLKTYVKNFTDKVTLIPTSIDLNYFKFSTDKLKCKNRKITIGWIGSQGTFGYLVDIFPALTELSKKYNILLKVVGSAGPKVRGLEIEYKDWLFDYEIDDMRDFDIGIMPLTNDDWSRGKSATKLLQYMAVGVPSIVSPIGVNSEIIEDGINGFLAVTKEDWMRKIALLIQDQQLRNRIVINAQNYVEKYYSVQVNAQKFLEVIKNVGLNKI